MNVNTIVISGNVGKIDSKTYQGDKNMVLISLAVWKYGTPPKTIWINAKAFDRAADQFLKQGVGVGDKVMIEGSLDEDQWTTKEGVERKQIVLTVRNVVKGVKAKDSNYVPNLEKESPIAKSSHDQIPNLDEIPF